jgi:hypothetical protein
LTGETRFSGPAASDGTPTLAGGARTAAQLRAPRKRGWTLACASKNFETAAALTVERRLMEMEDQRQR